MKDLCYLVIQLKCDDDCIEINMSKYVESLLNIFVMTVCEILSTERLYTVTVAVCTVRSQCGRCVNQVSPIEIHVCMHEA